MATAGDEPVELALDASPDARNYRVRGDRFAEAVGFEAEWDARSGAAELAAAFRMTGLTIDEARLFTGISRRLAALILLGPAFDRNYEAVKALAVPLASAVAPTNVGASSA